MTGQVLGRATLVGKTLGHYLIVEKVGAGGMGEVYRARDEHLEREVAIKILPPGTLVDDAARRRFRKEALTLSKLTQTPISVRRLSATVDARTCLRSGAPDGGNFRDAQLPTGQYSTVQRSSSRHGSATSRWT